MAKQNTKQERVGGGRGGGMRSEEEAEGNVERREQWGGLLAQLPL